MDKRKEEIAEKIKAVKYAPFNYGNPDCLVGHQMQDFVFIKIAEELLPLIEQYEKQAIKEFTEKLHDKLDFSIDYMSTFDFDDLIDKTFLESKTMRKRLCTEVCQENAKLKAENESLQRLLSLIDDCPKEVLLNVDKSIEYIKNNYRVINVQKE